MPPPSDRSAESAAADLVRRRTGDHTWEIAVPDGRRWTLRHVQSPHGNGPPQQLAGFHNLTDGTDHAIVLAAGEAPRHDNRNEHGNDPRRMLLHWAAIRCLAERCRVANRTPLMAPSQLQALRAADPDLPEPPPQIVPIGSDRAVDIDVDATPAQAMRLQSRELMKARGDHIVPTALEERSLTAQAGRLPFLLAHDTRYLDRYPWYNRIPLITGFRAETRPATGTSGAVDDILVTLRYRWCRRDDTNPRYAALPFRPPWWLRDPETLWAVRSGELPSPDELAELLQEHHHDNDSAHPDAGARAAAYRLSEGAGQSAHANALQAYRDELEGHASRTLPAGYRARIVVERDDPGAGRTADAATPPDDG